jgi:2-keto-4-pentenoate hydratase/2-oxohepta-3-ene-1,7-dioic acid hydratase in catechol pathway
LILATIETSGSRCAAIVDIGTNMAIPLDVDMLSLIRSGVEGLDRDLANGIDLSAVRILAPLPRPARNIFCVGKNYREHAQEFTRSGFDSSAATLHDAVPSAPIIFSKVPESVIGSEEAIRHPAPLSDAIDYEAELAVVIGKGGKAISRDRAYDHVFGYSIINDVTARDLQSKHKQWLIGKSLDTFCPMGPWIVTADQVDPRGLSIRCWVNGELRQDANTADLIFDIPTLIETISAGITLQPGDIIATGTPAGVGIGFDPPRYLALGDVVEIEIEGLGRLRNPVA